MRNRCVRRLGSACLGLTALCLSTVAHAQTDPPYIYGIHDAGGAHHMGANRGWIVFTVVAWDPPQDYRAWSNQGYGVIVRLNNGYEPAGTLPPEADYGAFASRCAYYVQNSPGVHYWIVGNEPNLPREWPGGAAGEPITVTRYVSAYNRVYDAVKAVAPGARICPAPSGTYAPPFPGQGIPGFVDYWAQVLNSLPASRVDGLILHTYTHGCDPNLVFSDTKFGPGPYYNLYHFHFRVYRDYMAVVPGGLTAKPVLITETDQNVECADAPPPPRHTWANANSGWVRNAYAEVDNWNRTHNQKIRCLALFRWDESPEGEWNFSFQNRPGVIGDWVQAVAQGYRWDGGTPDCTRGRPRTHYAREYWVIDSRASLTQVQQVVQQAYPNRITVGFSYDDAGIGDLDVRKVTVWGDEHDRNVLLSWYRQHYGGVSVAFRALPGQGSWHFGPYETTPPSSCRGRPRVQYARQYWVIDSRARLDQVQAIVQQGYAGRRTIGFSYDDAGIGDLDQRQVVVWGNEHDPNVLRQWYGQYYPGVTLSFQGLPFAVRAYEAVELRKRWP